jgi:hypothetical protein
LLLKAARQLEPFDLDLARDTYLTAWGTAFGAAGHPAGRGVFLEICRAVQGLEGSPCRSGRDTAQRPAAVIRSSSPARRVR